MWFFGLAALIALAAGGGAGPCPRAEAAEHTLTAHEIDRAVRQLGDAEYSVRQRASQVLWEAGKTAEPALQKALDSSDYEVVYRARQILDRVEWGILPDTPPRTVARINRFRSGGAAQRQEVCRELAEAKDSALLRRLIERETNPEQRKSLAQQFLPPDDVLNRTPAQHVAQLLLEGDFDGAERLLAEATDDGPMRDYAALVLARGKSDAKIAELEGRLRQQPDPDGYRRLACLLRAKGDAGAAVAAAQQGADDRLVEELLIAAGRWAEVARSRPDMPAENNWARGPIAALGRLAAYQRLAGQTAEGDQTVAAILTLCREHPDEAGFGGGVLLLNGRYGDGIDVMYRQDPAEGFRLLCCRNEFREAFRRAGLADLSARPDWTATLGLFIWAKDAPVTQGFRLGCEMARALHHLGEREKLGDLLAVLAAAATRNKNRASPQLWGPLLWNLSACETDMGLSEQATAHAALYLARNPGDPHQIFYKMFAEQAEAAGVLWRALRAEYASEKEAAALARLQRLLAPGPPASGAADELRKLAVRVEQEVRDAKQDAQGNPFSDARVRPLLVLASFLQARGLHDLALVYAEKVAAEPAHSAGVAGTAPRPLYAGNAATETDTLLKLGDIFAEEKQWDRAARAYEDAWSKDHRNATALYLLGHAKLHAGKEAEGRRQMELASLLPLGDGMARYRLIEVLKRLKLADEAERQCTWLLGTCSFGETWAMGYAQEYLCNAASLRGDRLAEAAYWERRGLGLIQPNTFLLDNRGYIILPFQAHFARGRGLLGAGKAAEGLEQLRQAEAALPGSVELVLAAVPELEQAGRKADADALYQRAVASHEAICRDFPRSSVDHNDLAWMAASLGRDLDHALAHANRAVELKPDRAAYLDTLAEVHFRRGDRAQATRLMKRCLELDPKSDYFHKQLARFQSP
jgi:tetratricopeptide (TPR) repeat protein